MKKVKTLKAARVKKKKKMQKNEDDNDSRLLVGSNAIQEAVEQQHL